MVKKKSIRTVLPAAAAVLLAVAAAFFMIRNRSVHPASPEPENAETITQTAQNASVGEAGEENRWESDVRTSPLLINEIVSAGSALTAADGQTHDWVELKNISSQHISLSDYALSDSTDPLDACSLPDRTLAPGEICVIFCDSDVPEEPGDDIFVSFGISDGETVCLLSLDSEFQDWCLVNTQVRTHSIGRMDGTTGWFYFSDPTPGEENCGGVRTYADVPAANLESGVYNTEEPLQLTLTGAEKIYYTLDGSTPTKDSSLYTAPVSISSTCVVRAIGCGENMLDSPVLDLSYVVNEGDTLDVVSISVDPELFWGTGYGGEGIYYDESKTRECLCHASLMTTEGTVFSLDCGLAYSGNKGTGGWQGWKLKFKDKYAGTLVCDVFNQGRETEYGSLALRTGVSREYWMTADVVYQDLAADCLTDILTQDWRYVSLYINGEYFGAYQLRERYDKTRLANEWGVDKSSVEILKGSEIYGTDLGEILEWASGNNLALEENYRIVSDAIDLGTLADWIIVQGISGNTDHANNIKWARSMEYDGKWHILLYDVDRPLSVNKGIEAAFSSPNEDIARLAKQLYKNEEFQQMMIAKVQKCSPTLTDENVVAKIEEVDALAGEEIQRMLSAKWSDPANYTEAVDKWKRRVVGKEMFRHLQESCKSQFRLSNTEYNELFPQE